MSKHAAEDGEIGIDRQARITNAVKELIEATTEIHPERRVEFLAYIYTGLVTNWTLSDKEKNEHD